MMRRYLIAGGVALGIALLFFLFVLKPKSGQITDVQSMVEQEHQKTQTLQLQLSQLRASAQNDTQTRQDLAKFDALLPSDPALPSLIAQLQTAATISGVDLVSIAPSPPAALANATGVDTVNVNLQITGGFFRLETFLTQMEDDIARVVEVQSLSVAPSTDPATGLTTLSSTISFQMFVVHPNARVSGSAPRPSASPSSSASPSPSPIGTATR